MSYGVFPNPGPVGPVGPPGPPGPGITPLYGSFTANATQAITIGGTTIAALDTTEASNGIARTPTSVVVPVAGVYLFNFSAQLHAGGNAKVYLWLRRNGNNEPRTTSELDLAGSARHQLPFVEFMLSLAALDAIEVAMSTTAACDLQYYPAAAGPSRPATPAIIVNCHRIG